MEPRPGTPSIDPRPLAVEPRPGTPSIATRLMIQDGTVGRRGHVPLTSAGIRELGGPAGILILPLQIVFCPDTKRLLFRQ